MSAPVHTNTRRRLALLFSVPLAFSVLFLWLNLAAERTDTRLIKIHELSANVADLRALANDTETGARGYLLSGDEHYLAPLLQANAALPGQIASSLRSARDWPDLEPQVKTIVKLVRTRCAEANQVVTVNRTEGMAAAVALTTSGEAEQTMNNIRSAVSRLQAAVNKQQDGILERERALNRSAFLFFVIGTLVMAIVLVWLYNAVVSYLYARDAAHAELQSLNAELENRIEERTRELQQSNQELQQFAYVASHDLQEPLRTITSFTQLLANRYQGKLDEDADEFIGYIVTSSRRMTDLINGLLALVRLRKAGQPTAPVSFEKLLEEAEIALQAAIRESQAEIQRGPLPALVVDQVQFSQVLQNLISNAIKYRSERAPQIRVEAKRDSSNWIFSVSDNGRGFNQQFAERIFDLFQRLHTRDVEGTGMGLSIARRVVERHGGRIWAESKEGVGSTFYFSLPITLESSRLQQMAGARELVSAQPEPVRE
jgi:signal transduction histidine kinase